MVAIPFPTISLALKTQKDCKREGGSPEDSQWKDCGGNSAQQTAQKTRQKWSLQELGFAMKLYEDYQWTLLIEHNAVRENIAHWFVHWKGNTICTLASSATVQLCKETFQALPFIKLFSFFTQPNPTSSCRWIEMGTDGGVENQCLLINPFHSLSSNMEHFS